MGLATKRHKKAQKKSPQNPCFAGFCESLCIFVAENNARHSAGHICDFNLPECLKLVPFGSGVVFALVFAGGVAAEGAFAGIALRIQRGTPAMPDRFAAVHDTHGHSGDTDGQDGQYNQREEKKTHDVLLSRV
jgi:hypothetical protein